MSRLRDSWAYRKGRMQPQHSRMENSVLIALHLRGLKPLRDVYFKLKDGVRGNKRGTIPDYYFRRGCWAVYLDGVVHARKHDRDEKIRRELQEEHPEVQVFTVSYTGYSGKEVDRLTDEIAMKVLRQKESSQE